MDRKDDTLFLQTEQNAANMPLAYRMRPRTLDEYIGQQHIIGPGKLLRRAIQADRLSSVIFYGPPGTGKTTLASVIANTTKSEFRTMNAVLSGVKELRFEIDEARQRLSLYGRRTILFVDEVHRWNKSQQDALLPWVENGTFILIGATTENPFFEVNAALVSRSRIFQLKSLTDADLLEVAKQALSDKERGYGKLDVAFEEGALEHLIDVSKGDARSLLNALELAVETTVSENGRVFITKDAAEQSIQQKAVLYDKEGDYHFDVISAFIKSLRGSDPDAALYWLAKMVNAGEDPRFIFRRMLISACEDIGLADPNAISVVESDAAAYERIGLPEGQFHLAHAALYLSTAKKSNSTLGYFDALSAVKEENADAEVPNHLRDASRDAKGFGHGDGYLYPHAYRDHWVAQNYLPKTLQGRVFYRPGKLGYEASVADDVARRREAVLESDREDDFTESLSFSPGDGKRDLWVKRASGQRSATLSDIRDRLFNLAALRRSDTVLITDAGWGFLAWEAFRQTPEGQVIAKAQTDEQAAHIQSVNASLDEISAITVIRDFSEIPPEIKPDALIMRNCFRTLSEEELVPISRIPCAKDAKLVFAQALPFAGSRLSDFVSDGKLRERLETAEKKIYAGRTGWGAEEFVAFVSKDAVLKKSETAEYTEKRIASETDVRRWISNTYAPALGLSAQETDFIASMTASMVAGRELEWKTRVVFCLCRKG